MLLLSPLLDPDLVAFAGVSHKGYVSKPPVPEEREAYRLHGEAVKKKKDEAKDAATRKRERKERHMRRGGRSPPRPSLSRRRAPRTPS